MTYQRQQVKRGSGDSIISLGAVALLVGWLGIGLSDSFATVNAWSPGTMGSSTSINVNGTYYDSDVQNTPYVAAGLNDIIVDSGAVQSNADLAPNASATAFASWDVTLTSTLADIRYGVNTSAFASVGSGALVRVSGGANIYPDVYTFSVDTPTYVSMDYTITSISSGGFEPSARNGAAVAALLPFAGSQDIFHDHFSNLQNTSLSETELIAAGTYRLITGLSGQPFSSEGIGGVFQASSRTIFTIGVPEPSSLSLLALAALKLLGRRR